LGCMRKIEQDCDVFVIRATPLNVKTSDAATSVIARDPRREAIFILDVERGVIAFEESTDWPKQVDVSKWDLNSIGRTAAMYTLIGKSGVLAKPGIKSPEQPDRDTRGCVRLRGGFVKSRVAASNVPRMCRAQIRYARNVPVASTAFSNDAQVVFDGGNVAVRFAYSEHRG